MNAKIIKLTEIPLWPHWRLNRYKNLQPVLVMLFLWLLYILGGQWLHDVDKEAGYIDQNICLLILLSLISFMLIVAICQWLLKQLLQVMKLPQINQLVSQFNTLTLCQQLSFYWASFALLLLAAIACLSAIC